MSTKRAYSLPISAQKLKELKEKKCVVVSHACSPRWENFFKKKLKKVRFVDYKFFDDGTFIVKKVERVFQLGEHTIRIEIL